MSSHSPTLNYIQYNMARNINKLKLYYDTLQSLFCRYTYTYTRTHHITRTYLYVYTRKHSSFLFND